MMKDRLKYKIWDKDRKKMFDCIQINFTENAHGSNLLKDNESSIHLMYQPHLCLLQCTGKKDKNGKLIYENFIVWKKGNKDYKGNKLYSQVYFDEMYARFCITDENGIHNIPTNPANVEIVGNIYENSDLLKIQPFTEDEEENA